ncbi:MAG TPA: response regulator, partial [Bacilli bacterium]
MYKVILIDDEVTIRSGLKSKIDWESIGFCICGEAANGRDALDFLEMMEVHVMITDIRMPIMNGLELLKQCSQRFPMIKIIVLSGYDDFSYVKIALQNGAKGYLLKPVHRNELIETLTKIRSELDEELQEQSNHNIIRWQLQQNLPILQEQLLLQLINEEWEGSSKILEKVVQLGMGEFLVDHKQTQFICVEMRIPSGRLGEKETGRDLLRSAFFMMCREIAQKRCDRAFAFHHWSHPNMMHFM